jgi:hypothetical protein
MHGIVGLNLILIDFCTQRLHGNALMILGVKLTAVLLHLIGVPDVRAILFLFCENVCAILLVVKLTGSLYD